MTTTLTATAVEDILKDVLYTDDELAPGHEPPADAVIVYGILNGFAFHPGRLAGHRDTIVGMLHDLPASFQLEGEGAGGGMSFLNACDDREGTQWTGLHRTMDWLFCLGQGVEACKLVLPREMWGMLPGGMPYYQVVV